MSCLSETRISFRKVPRRASRVAPLLGHSRVWTRGHPCHGVKAQLETAQQNSPGCRSSVRKVFLWKPTRECTAGAAGSTCFAIHTPFDGEDLHLKAEQTQTDLFRTRRCVLWPSDETRLET